ncbi:hypothetical protein EV361DRAFT_867578 [Lentinula raphanica]|uniref:Uncharacterized protein n=1 Tax=Lentinula raphanica TaxID=153919 RepID=A0AA38PFJ8_9AGAR|nr:hypothetical protein FB446DRAFT_784511 [Lentinula raphanica]KAJ3842004.1 hypothetical protein F5878DRAFT_657998 [Lentinula raphanica]KAJ3972617.1 hypothetical protein EV361DRAFT_867578 [Lentinula raphanica]
MFTTLVTVTLFAVAAINGAAADTTPDVETPSNVTTCAPTNISWTPTTGPYDAIIVASDDPCGDALVDFGVQDGTSVSWTPNIAPGTQVVISVVDGNDEESWSGTITIQQGSDISCVPADALAAASSSAAAASSSAVASSSVASDSASVAVTGTTLVVTGAASTASVSSASASSSAGPLGAVGQDGPLEASSNGAMTLATAPIMVLSAFAGILVLFL